MWYLILGGIALWAFSVNSKERPTFSGKPSPQVTDEEAGDGLIYRSGDWEEKKRRKAESLQALIKSCTPAKNNDDALEKAASVLETFHQNHDQAPKEIASIVEGIDFSSELSSREGALRKEMNKFYKMRDDKKSKAIAIQLAFEHARLQLQHPGHSWKRFEGLQKLKSNWKSEEYFRELMLLIIAFKQTFSNSAGIEKLSADANRLFELWNNQKIAYEYYMTQLELFEVATCDSDRHFIILEILRYLDRRSRFNPQFKDDLVRWCLLDVKIYENFLKEFNSFLLPSPYDDYDNYDDFDVKSYNAVSYNKKSGVKQKNIDDYSFDEIKKMKGYGVPRLMSYDILEGMYEKEGDKKRLQWLEAIGHHIGYLSKK